MTETRPIRFTSSGKLVAPDELVKLESRMGRRLPAEFREFLLKNNVASPESNIYEFGNNSTAVERFLGVSEKDADDLVAVNHMYEGRLPRDMIAIGMAAGGNLICLHIQNGAVYFWDHEGEAMGDDVPSLDNMDHLSPSFASFLAALRSYTKDIASNPGDVSTVWKKPGFEEKFKKYLSDDKPAVQKDENTK
jgi:hypothetical protein